MRVRLRDESGMALATALMLLAAMIGLGLAAVSFADSQQHAARKERTRESSFDLAEAALNAQVLQLGRAWPSSSGSQATALCTPTSGGSTCPDPAMLDATHLGGGNPDYAASSSCAQPQWTVRVQDDMPAGGGMQFYSSPWYDANAASVPAWDFNRDGSVWIRATAAPQCHLQTVVGLATHTLVPMDFPQTAITANWFQTGNNGNKIIVNTQGKSSQRGDVLVRCNGVTATQCKSYRAGQVAPDSVGAAPSCPPAPQPCTTLTADQLNSLRQQADVAGTHWTTTCPPAGTSLDSPATGQFAGAPVVVEGPCSSSVTGPGNSPTRDPACSPKCPPGVLVIVKASSPTTPIYSLGANSVFYGLVYVRDEASPTAPNGVVYNSPAVLLNGCAKVVGAIVVDNNGGVNVGQCKQNVIYDPTAFGSLRTYAGAALARSGFRVLPGGTP